MSEGRRRLALGIVDYLNSWPLAWGFLQGDGGERFDPLYLPPSQVAEGMAAGEIDVGLLPSVELQRIDGLSVVPGLCIASSREVRSVLLVSTRPVAEIRRVALDTSSRTSAALVQILLAEVWGVAAEYAPAAPELDAMLATADAALIIGDAALAVDRDRYAVVDLAASWRELTGLPFVFAVWAAAADVDVESIAAELEASLARGEAELDLVVARAVERLRLPAAEVRHYLTENLSYRLGAAERRSLATFFSLAHRHGLLGEPRPLAFVGEPASQTV